MTLYTTYLAFLRKVNYNPLKVFPNALEETIFHYVMRNRKNNEVAPDDSWWVPFKRLLKGYPIEELWEQYVENYTFQIGLSKDAREWIRRVAEEAKRANVVLICYEKNANYCHRKLLAEEISRRFNVDYNGELTEENLKPRR